MATFDEVVSQMRATLAITEPTLDTTVGSVSRRMLDAVAEGIAEAYVDSAMLAYQYDIDSKRGPDLDSFVEMFGFARKQGRRATATVTFERSTPALQPIAVPQGTRIGTEDGSVVFETLVPAVLSVGETLITVAMRALSSGSDGNVPSGAIRRRVSDITGFTSFSNVSAATGGTDTESDQALRHRFKRTVFRSLAGTEDMYLAVALEDSDVTQATVLGVQKRWLERIEVVGGTATSTNPGARYIYPSPVFFGRDVQGGDHFTEGVHYTFDETANPPTITVLDGTEVPDGVYDLDYAYVPTASRNDVPAGINNRVDVYVNGERFTEATQTIMWQSPPTFNDTPGSPYERANFRREDDSQPLADNYFIRLGFAPVVDAASSNTIIIAGETYTEGEDFWLVNDVTPAGGTPTSLSGIEFLSAANGQAQALPTNGDVFTVTYTFNAVPRDIEDALRLWSLVTSDVRVHAARKIRLRFHLAVILTPGYNLAAIGSAAEQAISDYLNDLGFEGVVQVSDLLSAVSDIPGVDAVRFLTSADDATDYAIQRMTAAGAVLETYDNGGTPARAIDVSLRDDQVAVVHDVVMVAKAQNSFGTV